MSLASRPANGANINYVAQDTTVFFSRFLRRSLSAYCAKTRLIFDLIKKLCRNYIILHRPDIRMSRAWCWAPRLQLTLRHQPTHPPIYLSSIYLFIYIYIYNGWMGNLATGASVVHMNALAGRKQTKQSWVLTLALFQSKSNLWAELDYTRSANVSPTCNDCCVLLTQFEL